MWTEDETDRTCQRNEMGCDGKGEPRRGARALTGSTGSLAVPVTELGSCGKGTMLSV